MLTSILAAFHLDQPASLKRIIATTLSGLVVLLLPKYASAISDTQLELFSGIVATYLLQSGLNSAAQAKAAGVTAAAAVTNPAQAVEVLNSEPKL